MKKIIVIIIALTITSATYAQDRVFAYAYQSNVLNKGSFGLEFQNTLATGKSGDFSPYVFGQSLKQRLELEFGLGHNLQSAFYFNSELSNIADTSSSSINQELKVSFSNEWKWKLTDPVANGFGSALYAEFEFGGNNVEFEGKLILDKRVSKNLYAFNLSYIYEIEKTINRTANHTIAEWDHHSLVELYFGYMHFFEPEFSLGIEARNSNDITKDDGRINSVLFAGPAMHINVGKCFILLTALPQIVNLHKTDIVPGKLDLVNYEASEFRLLVGYDF